MITYTATRLGNGEFLLKLLSEGTTVMTWTLTTEQAESLWLELDTLFEEINRG